MRKLHVFIETSISSAKIHILQRSSIVEKRMKR